MSSLLALGCLLPSVALAGAPLDVKATFGEQVAKDLDTLVELKAQGPVSGAGTCLKVYMEAVLFEQKGNPIAKDQFRACASRCAKQPAATVEGAKEIAQRYAKLCRERSGQKEPEAAALAAQGPVTRTKAAGACDSAKTKGACREYPSFGLRTEEEEKKVCELTQGTWVSGQGCPEQNQIGACVDPNTNQVQRWYDAGGNKGSSAAKVKEACEATGGRLVAGAAGSPGPARPSPADLERAAASVASLLGKKDVAGAEKALVEKLGPPQRKSVDAGITSWFSAVKGSSCSELRLSDLGGGMPPKAKVIPAAASDCK